MTTQIGSKDDLVQFVKDLLGDLSTNGATWENSNLEDYLEALAASIDDIDGYYRNHGIKMEELNAWRLMADILKLATIYE